MSLSDLWGLVIVLAGATGAVLFASATWRAAWRPSRPPTSALIMGVTIVAACLYSAVVWSGQFLQLWTITPELGRPALALALVALISLGLQAGRPAL